MLHLHDLLDARELDEMLTGGYVREQKHPTLPLRILNYTPKAAYDEVWNDTTLACRGLIHDSFFRVVARPFPKFFNYGQPGCPEIHLDAPATVTEKLDGSLGILYPRLRAEGRLYLDRIDGYEIATRGSFTSDQALHASKILEERYYDWSPDPYATYLFEIIYPENRIVLDYGDTDDLFLLAILDTDSGERITEREALRDAYWWPGPHTDTHPYRSMAEALAAEPRPNAEGFVVAIQRPSLIGGPDVLVKIKQEDYVALHRIVTGLNKRTVWAHLDQGLPIEDLIAPLPDEFKPWVEDVVAELSALVAAQAREIENEFTAICLDMSRAGETTRKEYALRVSGSRWSWALFLRLDGRDYSKKLWHLAKPEPLSPAGRTFSEDTA